MAASRADVAQKLYLSPETVIGAAVMPLKRFPSLSIEFERVQDDQFYRPSGQLVPGSGVKHREWSEPKYKAAIDYNELAYIFSGLFGVVSPTNPAGSAYVWTWTPTESNFGTPQTFSARMGDTLASALVPGMYFNSFDMKLSDDTAEVSGDCFGYAIEDNEGPISATLSDEAQQLTITGAPTGGTFTLTYSGQTTAAIAYNASAADIEAALWALSNIPDQAVQVYGSGLPDGTITIHFVNSLGAANAATITSTDSLTGGSSPATVISTLTAGGATSYADITQQPVSKNQVNLFIDSSYGAIGTTKFCDALELGLTIPKIREMVKVLCTYYPSFKDAVAIAVEAMSATTVLIKNTAVISFMNSYNVSSKPTYYFRYEATGAVISGAYSYKLTIDMAVKCATPKERRNVKGVYAYEIANQFVADASLGGPIKITLTNTVASL